MPIDVKVVCSDCGTESLRRIKPGDKEIICYNCYRVMPSISNDEYKQVERTLGSQFWMGVAALTLFAACVAGRRRKTRRCF